LTFSLTGNASNHAQSDRVYDITLTFQNSAFIQGNASDVSNYSKSDIGVFYLVTFSGGAGTEGSPYLISNKTDLRILSENWGEENLWNKHYQQTVDISFEASDFQSGGNFYNEGEGWIPIGNASSQFSGTYDGQNHTIFNVFINRSAHSQGLFGRIILNSKVENLRVNNVDVSGTTYIGALVGDNYQGNISNCYSSGSVNGSNFVGGLVGRNDNGTISNSYSACIVSGSEYVGGLVGSNSSGNVSNSYSAGNISGNQSVGGFVGQNTGTISNCYSTGNVTKNYDAYLSNTRFGGFVGGHFYTTIANSYSTGFVSYERGTPQIQTDKGFAGYTNNGTYVACFWDTETSGASATAGTAIGKTTAEMKTQATFTDWDFTDVWAIDSGYPYLQWQNFSDFPAGEGTDLGDGTIINPSGDLDYAADQTIPEIPNGSFTPEHEFVLSGSGIVDIVITTSSQFGAYYQGGSWHTEENSGGTITFTGIDFDARGDIPIILGDDDPLPVTLSTFTAQFVNQELTIIWSTQSETNNSHWNIWRAVENTIENAERLNGENIGAAGNSNELIEYSFVDNKEVENHTTYYYWLESVDYSGQSNFYGSTSITIDLPDNPEAPEIPVVLGLHQNYPNPFNPSTKIRFAVKEAGNAEVTIFNMKGQKITTIFSGNVEANSYYEAIWNGRDDNAKDVASGVYLYKLETAKKTYLKRMLLIK
jgi:hypothetical protein